MIPERVNPQAPAIELDLFCQKCGYNLRGLTTDQCPECGKSFAALRSPVSLIPWVRRREIGWLRAYWATVWLVTFRHATFCWEFARPMPFCDSQSFRWVTVLHAWLPIVAVTSIAFLPIAEDLPRLPSDWMQAAVTAKWPVAVVQAFTLLFLAAATGIPSYFFHPPSMSVELQNRAIALSYYTSAPLACMAVAAAFGSRAFFKYKIYASSASTLLALSGAFVAALFLFWVRNLLCTARCVLPRSFLRTTCLAVVVPALWFGVGALIFVGPPAIVVYVAVVVASFD